MAYPLLYRFCLLKNLTDSHVINNSSDLDNTIKPIANMIYTYLEDRNDAADTFEGLVSWWLYRQRISDTEKQVSLAVTYLLKEGKIEKHELGDGNFLFKSIRDKN